MKQFLFALMMMALAIGIVTDSTQADEPPKPNIIYIMADDLGYGELGCYGQSKIKTPQIDMLAAEGMRFTQHYAGTAVCAPTRCSLMTGLHTGHCYIRANSPGYPKSQMPIPFGTETLGTMLKRAGYKTACIGKWGLGTQDNRGCALEHGFDHFFGYYDQRHAHNYYTDHLFRNRERIALDGKTYSHDLMTDEALKFVEDNRSEPFFLYLPYCIPHTKFQVPDLAPYKDTDWQDNHKTHAAMISRMDRDVGRLIEKLKELNIDENTLVFFTSDHGAHGQSGTAKFFKSSGKLRGVKRSLYEGGIRTPLVARWPGKIEAGIESDHVSAFWDMMPTLAELAGGEPSAEHDGVSLVPTMLGDSEKQKQHEYLYWELFEGRQHNRALRKGKWKAIIPNMYKSDQIQLFDLESDIGEQSDVAAKHPVVAAELSELLKTARVRSPFWNMEAKGFDVQAACKDTGADPPKKRKKNR